MLQNPSSSDRIEIRVYGVPKPMNELIETIAANLRITKTDFLRMALGKIARSYPVKISNPTGLLPKNPGGKKGDIRINNVDISVKIAINNIATNMGVTTAELLREELGRIVLSHPEYMRI